MSERMRLSKQMGVVACENDGFDYDVTVLGLVGGALGGNDGSNFS